MAGFNDAYQAALSGYRSGGGGGRQAMLDSISKSFQPGQYSKVNADIASRHQQQQRQVKPAPPPKPKPGASFLNRFIKDTSNVVGGAATGAGKAVRAVARPVTDVATGQGGKAAHDVAQLSTDVTGGSPNYLLNTAIANPIRETAAQVTGNKKAQANAQQKSNENLGLGKNGRNIAGASKKLAAETALTGLMFTGGGKVASGAAKGIGKATAKEVAEKAVHTAAGGAAGGAAYTVAQNPNASVKDISKNAVAGAALGAAVPIAGKAAGKVAGKATEAVSNKPAKELIQNTRTQNALEKLAAKQEAAKPKTGVDLPTLSEDQLPKTPPKPVQITPEQAKAAQDAQDIQEKATTENAKAMEKATTDSKKIDNKIELIQAKATKENPLSNVDKVKIKQLKEEQANIQSQTASGQSMASSPTETIQQHMTENYKPGSDHPDEAFAANHLMTNTDEAVKAYQERTKQIFGSTNIVGGDDAKYAVPGMDASKSTVYHEPASEFAKGYYKHLLQDESTKDKSVLITAGGTGAGKTSALKKRFNDAGIDPNDYAAIIDTNLTSLKSAVSRIEPALKSGRPVAVSFVYRDPLEAFENGVIPRAVKEGRAVTAATHAETHSGAIDTIKQLADHYQHNDNVSIEIIDNSRGSGNSIPVTLDFLHDKSYTKSEIEVKIHQLLDRHLQEGKLTDEQHAIFKGGPAVQSTEQSPRQSGADLPRVEQTTKPETGPKPEQPSPSGQVAEQKPNTGTSKVAQRIAKDLKAQYGDLAQYDKINLKDQAEKASALIADREKLDKVISGSEPVPAGLRATSIIAAVRNDPELLKDVDLLKRLASSPLSSESSYSAQELRIARENAKNDPVEAIKSISKARQQAFEKKTGRTTAKAVSKEIQQIRAAKPKTTPKDWNSFLEELKCR